MPESSYDRVLVNCANRKILAKSEFEYADAFWYQKNEKKEDVKPFKFSPDLSRKINILTSKYRPICSMSAVKCGLNWYVAQPKFEEPD